MKKIALSVALALAAVALLALPGTLVQADEGQKLNGSYVWDQGSANGELEAVFTATGEGTWDVSFYFNFRDEDHIYTGTAEGSLSNGTLAGKVQTEDKQATFTFTGTVTDGKFTGTHARVRNGEEAKTGTLTLGG